MVLNLWAGDQIQKSYERAIARYERDACDMAKQQARERYDVVEMDPGCRCEITDGREWLCDVGFTCRVKEKEK